METISLILHVLSAAVLVGGMVLLFIAVTPATWMISDEALRSAVARVVARRFAGITGVALAVLVATGLYQLFSVVPDDIRKDMTDYRFGAVFMVKMAVFVLLVVLIGMHGMYYGPRIARASEAVTESDGDDEAVWRLEALRRTSLLFSLVMLVTAVSVLALGVTLGNHDYSYVPFD